MMVSIHLIYIVVKVTRQQIGVYQTLPLYLQGYQGRPYHQHPAARIASRVEAGGGSGQPESQVGLYSIFSRNTRGGKYLGILTYLVVSRVALAIANVVRQWAGYCSAGLNTFVLPSSG